MPIAGDQEYPEDIRLRHRYLDLRREKLHNNIILRSQRDLVTPQTHD